MKLNLVAPLTKALKVMTTRELSFEIDFIPCRFTNLPPTKIINWLLTESSAHFKPARPWGFPTVIQVEVSSRCNLSCPCCPVSIGLERPTGHMDFGLFQKIIDEIGHTILVILFWDWGEPFLNPQAYEMIRYAHSHGIRVISSTNGHLFATPHHASEVVHSGLDALVFSLDGITQETYRQYRSGGKLQQVLEGITRVITEKRRLGSETPLVNLRFIVMKHNEQELHQIGSFASSLGVDLLTIRKFHMVHSGSMEHKGTMRMSPTQPKFQLPPIDQSSGRPLRTLNNPCRNLWNCPTIHWDGTVTSCFMDFAEKRPLGTLGTLGFKEIWYGPDFLELRHNFRKRWRDLPLCGDCSNGFVGGDVGSESNAEAIAFPRPL
jgi:MoaA/NifB/PqqE/SkfB family radical SAM enzyme